MESPEKFSNSKEVIAFLAESFPNCFSIEGEAKPLKIGIFQDLAERLNEEARVSKTLLRSALRHYTNSWRYLHSVKQGVKRVDLDGVEGEVIEQEHADHAKQQLDESKAKAAEKRKENAKRNPAPKRQQGDRAKAGQFKPRSKTNGTNPKNQRQTRVAPEKLTDENLKEGTKVTVKLGKSPMHAIITEVGKDGVHVQLDTGMVVKVAPDTLRLARSKRS